MVVINGVKYACERCIRGHRVTSCTHTDQPLTMIKPKGRPATQCSHCREQRKLKNLHSQCACGNKKKHGGNCGCHKTSVCTCKSKTAKKLDKKVSSSASISSVSSVPQVSPSASLASAFTDLPPQVAPPRSRPHAGPAEQANNYIIEDVVLPFDTSGMFDLFSRESTPHRPLKQVAPKPAAGDGADARYVHGIATGASGGDSSSSQTPQSESAMQPPAVAPTGGSIPGIAGDEYLQATDLSMVDRMFPLFPLVGSASLDNEDTLYVDSSRPTDISFAPTPMRPGLTRPESVLSDSSFDLPLSSTAYPPSEHQPQQPSVLGTDLFNPSNVFVDLGHMDFDSTFPNYGRTTPSIPEEYTGASIDGVFAAAADRREPQPFSSMSSFSPQTSHP